MATSSRRESPWVNLLAGVVVLLVSVGGVWLALSTTAFVSGASGPIVGRHTQTGKGPRYYLDVATERGPRSVNVPEEAFRGCDGAFRRAPFSFRITCGARSYTHAGFVWTVVLGVAFGAMCLWWIRDSFAQLAARRRDRG